MKRMKRSGLGYILAVGFFMLCMTGTAEACPIFETTGFITGTEGHIYPLVLGGREGPCQATLADLSFGDLAFDTLMLSISTSQQNLGSVSGAGSFLFTAEPETAYFANIFGIGGGAFDTGLYGFNVTHAPIPASHMLLLGGLACLLRIRKRSAGD